VKVNSGVKPEGPHDFNFNFRSDKGMTQTKKEWIGSTFGHYKSSVKTSRLIELMHEDSSRLLLVMEIERTIKHGILASGQGLM
jgi:hypothetical protein